MLYITEMLEIPSEQVFTLMINLKLYGLPRTYTNWVAYCVMKTFPEIKVWHNNCPSDPKGEKYWKHGAIRRVPDVDGYILVFKTWELWCASISRYRTVGTLKLDERFLPLVFRGWREEAEHFEGMIDEQVFEFPPTLYGSLRVTMEILLEEIGDAFDLKERPLHIESKRMWRCGDQNALQDYLTPEDYEQSSS